MLVSAYGTQPDGLHGYAFRSTDGGITWTPIASLPNTADSFAFVTASRWLLVVPNESVETLDAGRSWHAFPSDYQQAAGVPPQIVFVDSLVGYATVRGEIQRTGDGGVHWTVAKSPGT